MRSAFFRSRLPMVQRFITLPIQSSAPALPSVSVCGGIDGLPVLYSQYYSSWLVSTRENLVVQSLGQCRPSHCHRLVCLYLSTSTVIVSRLQNIPFFHAMWCRLKVRDTAFMALAVTAPDGPRSTRKEPSD